MTPSKITKKIVRYIRNHGMGSAYMAADLLSGDREMKASKWIIKNTFQKVNFNACE